MEEGAVCRPNISPRGRRLRRNFGVVMVMVGVGMLASLIHWQAWWPLRALVGVPMFLAATGFLQASRNTCVARAKEGMFEHDDMSKTAAPDDEVAASRKVAREINRDAALVGAASALVGLVTVLLG